MMPTQKKRRPPPRADFLPKGTAAVVGFLNRKWRYGVALRLVVLSITSRPSHKPRPIMATPRIRCSQLSAVLNGTKFAELADGIQTAAGPSGTKRWTFSSARELAGWLVALRPKTP